MAAMIQRGVRRCLRPLASPSAPSSRTLIFFVFSKVTEFNGNLIGSCVVNIDDSQIEASSGYILLLAPFYEQFQVVHAPFCFF